ncbi:MAG TPA: nucleoside triphosphate pyrophosphohydrolase [Ignavibacteriaceae bacterium]|nr:nucleoside triphosphate pyrophosphohydrolase [Ignavibacteriaceae bacterium]
MLESKFNEFVAIVKRLRKECPWDHEQTNDSIKAATIEEAYEVVEAIDNKDYNELKKELGDLLLHVVFHSVIASESNRFELEDVIKSITEKLIRRHPHVFGETIVHGADEVKKNWETIKLTEGRKSVLEGVPLNLPSLYRAYRLQEKAAKVGFEWSKKDDVWNKVTEEIAELEEADQSSNSVRVEEELGDLLFALTNYARFMKINPEDALRRANKKFEDRFAFIEKSLAEINKKITDSNLEEMEFYWEKSKTLEIKNEN